MIRTILVDDHMIFSDGLRRILAEHPQFDICACFGSGGELLAQLQTLQPDLVIVDIELPGMDGLEIIRRVRIQNKAVMVIVLSMHDEDIFKREARQAGADAYFTKETDTTVLIEGILNVCAGRKPSPVSAGASARKQKSVLSPQEMAILKSVAEGKTTVDIANILNISPLTVKTHRRNLFRKLGAENSAELVRIAYERGHL